VTIPEEDVGDEDKEEENDDDIVCEEDKKLRPPFFWSFGVDMRFAQLRAHLCFHEERNSILGILTVRKFF
jgi:hypothetical protein